MKTFNAQEASDLAKYFLGFAQTITDFRFDNWNSLKQTDNQNLYNLQLSVLKSGEDILALSTALVAEEVQPMLEQIKNISSDIKDTIKKLKDVQKGIDLFTAIAKFGAAVISKDPQSALSALGDLGTAWNDLKKDIANGAIV